MGTRHFTAILVILAPLWSAGVQAQGNDLFAENCAGCHGEAGEGYADLRAPALAAMNAEYLTRQISNMQSGRRRIDETNDAGLAMIDIFADLSSTDIEAISSYLAGLPTPALDDDNDPPGFRGRGLYSGCSSCHGARAQGTDALKAPRLSAQYGWYLRDQLVAFREGRRGFHEADDPGQQMKAMADAIESDADIDALVAYITALEP